MKNITAAFSPGITRESKAVCICGMFLPHRESRMGNWLLLNSAFERDRYERAGLGLPSPATKSGNTFFTATVVLLLFPLVAFGIITFQRNLPAELPLYLTGPFALTQSLDNGYLVSLRANKRIHKESLVSGTALLKLDSFANVERVVNFYEILYFIGGLRVSADSHYIMAGCFDELTGARGVIDAVVVKVKKHNGVIIWRYNYSGPSLDWISWVSPTPDGGCFATGCYSADTTPWYCNLGVVRLKSNGNPVWERIFRYPFNGTSLYMGGYDVLPMPDGGCIVSANFAYPRGEGWSGGCVYIMRLNSVGEPVWTVIDTARCGSGYGYFCADIFLHPQETLLYAELTQNPPPSLPVI